MFKKKLLQFYAETTGRAECLLALCGRITDGNMEGPPQTQRPREWLIPSGSVSSDLTISLNLSWKRRGFNIGKAVTVTHHLH